MLDKQSINCFDKERLLCQYVIYREAGLGVRGWPRLIDAVDLAISMIIINLAYDSSVPGAQPNQGTTGETRARFPPEQVVAWPQQVPGISASRRLPV